MVCIIKPAIIPKILDISEAGISTDLNHWPYQQAHVIQDEM